MTFSVFFNKCHTFLVTLFTVGFLIRSLPCHCIKSVHIRSYSGLHFCEFGLNSERYGVRMRENVDQNNSEYGHFSRRVWQLLIQPDLKSRLNARSQLGSSIQSGSSLCATLQVITQSTQPSKDCYPRLVLIPHFSGV